MTRRSVWVLCWLCVVASVLLSALVLWERPVRTPTYNGAAWVGSASTFTGTTWPDTSGTGLCVVLEADAGVYGLVLPDTHRAVEPGPLQAGMAGPSPEVRDEVGLVVVRPAWDVLVRGRLLDSDDASDAGMTAAWDELCAPVAGLILVEPYGLIPSG